jgi:Tfp pilus assembly protein PilF
MLHAPAPDANPAPIAQAREAYLRGKWFYDRKTPEDTARSIAYFREAVTLDPAYAPAHASLAAAVHFAAAMGVLDKTEAQRLTRASAERALELDPASGDALAILAESRFRLGRETDGVEELFRRAVALRPQDADIRHWYGMFLALTDRIGEALAQLERARDLDPLALHVGADYAEVLFMAGRRDEAMRQLARVRELDPEFPKTYVVEAHIALEEERHADAIAAMRRANELSPATPKYVASLAHLYALAGQPAEAQRTLAELRTLTNAAPELIRALEQELAAL